MSDDFDNEFDTTVLTDDYDDFRDTVVAQTASFDPSVFEKATAQAAGVSAAKAARRPQAAVANEEPARNAEADTVVLGAGVSYRPASEPARGGTGSMPKTAQPAPRQRTSRPAYQQAPAFNQHASQITSQMMSAVDKPREKSNRLLVGVLVAIAAVLVVVLIVVLVITLMPKREDPARTMNALSAPVSSSSSSVAEPAGSDSEVGVAPSESSSSSSGTSGGTVHNGDILQGGGGSGGKVVGGNASERTKTEKEVYDLLSRYYKQAAAHDANVSTCASDFENNWMKESRDERSNTAASLKNRIKADWDEVKRIEVPFMSKNAEAYYDICELYECLWHRIDVICSAWEISLKYDKPAKHKDEVMKPIVNDNVGGTNQYYSRFKKLYPEVELKKP